ncbi:MAG: hypothetical protein HFJ11_00985 [Bacilli bacterium]|nr:hypothetical protein [Bacilli bacterium]
MILIKKKDLIKDTYFLDNKKYKYEETVELILLPDDNFFKLFLKVFN